MMRQRGVWRGKWSSSEPSSETFSTAYFRAPPRIYFPIYERQHAFNPKQGKLAVYEPRTLPERSAKGSNWRDESRTTQKIVAKIRNHNNHDKKLKIFMEKKAQRSSWIFSVHTSMDLCYFVTKRVRCFVTRRCNLNSCSRILGVCGFHGWLRKSCKFSMAVYWFR